MPHALRPGGVRIPRGFRDSRSVVAIQYRRYVLALLERLGALPKAAMPTLVEAGRAAVELERLGNDLESARARRRTRDATRIRRQQFMLREQLTRLERRLEELAGMSKAPALTEYLAQRTDAQATPMKAGCPR